MDWTITNRNGYNSHVNAVATNNPEYTYVGGMKDYQPYGYGAIYKNGTLYQCGEWFEGKLEISMDEEEYNETMNRIFNHK